MIGDAKGDLDAAKNNGILFYPIIPGKEDESWEKFISEAYEKFIIGTYEGSYENTLIDAFMRSLPDRPESLSNCIQILHMLPGNL